MAMADPRIVRDERASFDSLAIVDKYEAFLDYAYPKIQNCPRKDGILRDQVLRDLLEPIPAFYAAGKSGQVSRLYLIDGQLATLRFWLRRLVAHKVMSRQQGATSLARLDEVGRMLGTWINKLKGAQRSGADGRPGAVAAARSAKAERGADSSRPRGEAGQ